jgi:hypothetical protein
MIRHFLGIILTNQEEGEIGVVMGGVRGKGGGWEMGDWGWLGTLVLL